jgi:hypothetical protein
VRVIYRGSQKRCCRCWGHRTNRDFMAIASQSAACLVRRWIDWVRRSVAVRGSVDCVMAGKLRRCGAIATVEILAIALAAAAAAMPTCEGTYSAMSLRSLPDHIVVGLDIHDQSPVNLRLAERFLAGVRKAGVDVGPEANVLLHVSISRFQKALTNPTHALRETIQNCQRFVAACNLVCRRFLTLALAPPDRRLRRRRSIFG